MLLPTRAGARRGDLELPPEPPRQAVVLVPGRGTPRPRPVFLAELAAALAGHGAASLRLDPWRADPDVSLPIALDQLDSAHRHLAAVAGLPRLGLVVAGGSARWALRWAARLTVDRPELDPLVLAGPRRDQPIAVPAQLTIPPLVLGPDVDTVVDGITRHPALHHPS